MAINYTKLTGYFDEQLGEIKSILAITSYNNTITKTLMDYGLSADFGTTQAALDAVLVDATDQNKLLAIALMNLWKYAANVSSGKYNQSADGASLSRSQIHDMCMQNYQMSLGDALVYMPNYEMGIDEVEALENPYKYYPPDERYDMRQY